MKLRFTKIFHRTKQAAKAHKTVINYGGSSSSKTISVLQLLTLRCLKYSKHRVTLVAESMPVIKKTIFADWRDVVMDNAYNHRAMNLSEMVYAFPNGSIFQFVPADDQSRFHGLRQNDLFIDEAYNVKKSIFDQGEIRTSGNVFLTFNPNSIFWAKNLFSDDDVYVIHSTYKDNPFLNDSIINSLEKRLQTDPNFWRVYGKGEWGALTGLIFTEGKNWDICATMPEVHKWIVTGLDFGFSADPSAIVDVCYSNGELWADEKCYELELTNPDIAERLNGNIVVADSAEPKSIAEIRRMGISIVPSTKGPDSISNGIKMLKQFKLNVTKNSINLIKELRNYKWAESNNGEQLNRPVDAYNHCIDAIRYSVTKKMHKQI